MDPPAALIPAVGCASRRTVRIFVAVRHHPTPEERRQRPNDEHQMTNKNSVQGWNKKPERHLVSIQLWRQDMIS